MICKKKKPMKNNKSTKYKPVSACNNQAGYSRKQSVFCFLALARTWLTVIAGRLVAHWHIDCTHVLL